MFNLKDYRAKFVEKAKKGRLTIEAYDSVMASFGEGKKPLLSNGNFPIEVHKEFAKLQGELSPPKPEDLFYREYQLSLAKAKKQIFSIDRIVAESKNSKLKGSKLERDDLRSLEKFRDKLEKLIENPENTRQDILTFLNTQLNLISSQESGKKFVNHIVSLEFSLGTNETVVAKIYGKNQIVNKYVLEQEFLVDSDKNYTHKRDRRKTNINLRSGGSNHAINLTVDAARKAAHIYQPYGVEMVRDQNSNAGWSLVSLKDIFIMRNGNFYQKDEIKRHLFTEGRKSVKVCASCGSLDPDSHTVDDGEETVTVCGGCVGLEGFRQTMRDNNKEHYNDPIRLHGLKPEDIGTKRLYGVELEFNGPGQEKLISKRIVDICESHWAAKQDGSVGGGVEFVSMPASLEDHRAGFRRISESPIFAQFDLRNAGIHVHVNRKSLSELTVFKLIHFMADSKNKVFIDQMAGRSANQYCERKTSREEITLNKEEKLVRSGGKYRAINTVRKETIEFRIFSSTKDEAEFMQRLQFVDAILKFCENNDLKSMKYENFCAWYVMQAPHILKRWVELSIFLDTLKYIAYKPNVQTNKEIKKCA